MNEIRIKIIEGDPVFMLPILLLLFVILLLILTGFINRNNRKIISLISSFGWLALFGGILGQAINIYNILTLIQFTGNPNFGLLAGD